MSFGERLKSLRKKLGLTQKEFANRIEGKVDYTYIGKVERGQQYPSLKMLERIGKSFSVPLSYFFEEDSIATLLSLLPQDIRSLLKDTEKQKLLRISDWLDEQDFSLLVRIADVLVQTRKELLSQVADDKGKYEVDEREKLALKLRQTLSSPGITISLEEPWVREALRIALFALEKTKQG
ncbi:helix-turn-helix transcriptional regulator [Candidatus Aerophobetes bacterium]|nr:helix-turn-helix transcriptional regulator [Candidatus Aerophobetes bacterium]